MLQLLAGVVLCAPNSGSTLLAQQPHQEFEPVDPDSAEIPRSWFENVPVTPSGLGINIDDVPAYFRILKHLQQVPAQNLVEADREFRLEMIEQFGERTRNRIRTEMKNEAQQKRVLDELDERLKRYREDPFTYPLVRDAFNLAEDCQGRVVSFSGHARRPRSFAAGENDDGFDQLYEIWLFDEEANHYPVVVVCTELPENMPLNLPDKAILDGVSVRGYFFKLYAYEGGEQYHAIPMILAKTVTWNPPKPVSRSIPGWAYIVVIVIGIVALALIIRSNRSNKALRTRREHEENPFQSAS